jgi:hypothetical protein
MEGDHQLSKGVKIKTHLKGARFRWPESDKDETKAMGRGIMALVRRKYESLSKSSGQNSSNKRGADETHALDMTLVSHVFQPSSSWDFQDAERLPSPHVQEGSGGALNWLDIRIL